MYKTKYDEMIGKRYGMLIVNSVGGVVGNNRMLNVTCDCGNTKSVRAYSVRNGETRSCGCLKRLNSRKHGMTGTDIWNKWHSMLHRCRHDKDYVRNGIHVCSDWQDFEQFKNWAYNNGYKEGLSIERIDVCGDYTPENCTWIPLKQQPVNRSITVYLTHDGETHTMAEWSRRLGIKYTTLEERHRKGWSDEKCLAIQR